MIDVLRERIIRGDIDEKIRRWETWFRTPFGQAKSLQEAVKICESAGIDARLAIVPSSVAISDSTHEVWERG